MKERVQTTAASANLTGPNDTRRVIIRYANGSILRGYLNEEEIQDLKTSSTDQLAIQNVAGNREMVEVSGLKAIFFVKSFEGSQDYSEFKVFTHQPSGVGVWVRVHFHDGEVMEGIAPNELGTFADPVFSLTPPDPQSNNETVILSKNCLENMQILGLASD
jgi:hypothetical protein